MSVDKDALVAEALELRTKLELAADAKRAELQAEGRPFDRKAFMQGRDLDVRYVSGPAFQPYKGEPTLLSLTLGVSLREWAWTLAGAAVTYGTAFHHGEPKGAEHKRAHAEAPAVRERLVYLERSSAASV